MKYLLVIGDASLQETVEKAAARSAPCSTRRAATVDEALPLLSGAAAIIFHLQSPADGDLGTRLLRWMADHRDTAPVLFIADFQDTRLTLTLLRLGAMECLVRPLNIGRLAFLLEMAAARGACKPQAVYGDRDEFLLASPAMKQLLDQVRMVARLDTTVLLTGETGTGKTALAHFVHEHSPHRGHPFLTVNCGSLSDALIESELFGHARGAFTGADKDYEGKFAQAGSGTLLLDDVEAMPLPSQAKLLRSVEERVFEPVGSAESKRLSARLIVASNRALQDEVLAGRFREDLFYRLSVVVFHLPPLRERKSEIRLLADSFVERSAANNGLGHPRGFSSDAWKAMQDYDWPGNVRQLKNVVERGIIMAGGGEIQLHHLPAELSGGGWRAVDTKQSAHHNQLSEARDNAECLQLRECLQAHGNNRTQTAKSLGISRVALYKKLHKYGLI